MTTTTNTNELTDRQIQLGEMLAALGYEGSWWCPRGQDIQTAGRVYLNTTRRDAKVWISFENPAECKGPKLNIKVTSEYQPKAWCYAEEEKVDRKFRNADAAAHRFADGETDISDLL